jgi:2'-5' RNA ligase
MRLFFALWPDPKTQQEWFTATAPLLEPLGGRRVPAAGLHMTLHFLGEVTGSRVNALTQLGEAAAASAIELRFDRIEAWSKAELACLRTAEDGPGLVRLVGYLGSGLALAGFAVERRRFKGHVTLARKLTLVEPSLPLWPPLVWRADTLALVRSRLGPGGSEYDIIANWNLR